MLFNFLNFWSIVFKEKLSKMKSIVIGLFLSAAIFAVVYGADEKKPEEGEGIKIYKRLIPADVLRGKSK